MEEDEEEDRLVLSRLGIQSANPEDIEHDILTKVENDSFCVEENFDEQRPSETHENTYSSSSIARAKLYSKLRAIEFELDAVASSIEHTKAVESCEDVQDTINGKEECVSNKNDPAQVNADGLTIQQALAVERLKSLKKEKSRLQNEISNFNISISDNNASTSKLLNKLVQEEPQHKKSLKESQQFSRSRKQKTAVYDEDVDFDAVLDAASAGFMETERDELVRKGVLTPFHKLKGFERRIQQSGPSNGSNLQGEEINEDLAASSIAKVARSLSEISQARPATKYLDLKSSPKLDGSAIPFRRLSTPLKHAVSPAEDVVQGRQKKRKLKRPLPDKKWRKKVDNEILLEDKRNDPVMHDYDEEEHGDSRYSNDRGLSSVILEGGLKIPDSIYTKLFDYQKVGVQWLWELHCQRAGGIIGDEMGLGKTIQVISFLAALHFSSMYKPSIVICPVTLLQQWRREAQKWYPNFHVEILHDSAYDSSKAAHSKCSDSDCESDENSLDSEIERIRPAKSAKKWDNLIGSVLKSESGLLITTYEQLRILREKLLDIEWGYAILDEGHRIRNPNADVTLACKQLQTVHRIIMTGAPIQNKLAELWSLFDFVFPGKLGVLPVFEIEFAVPISIGGYANATPLQVSTAYRCAVVLRDLIMPYMLRRMKADVNAQLPKKTEHVLFCSLTSDQRALYRAFLASSEVEQIFDGNRNSLSGIDVMRKICNHPDLLEREHAAQHPDYGNLQRSGKMVVMAKVLEVWREQGHHVLVFTQTQQMLDILEKFINSSGYIYRRMDGLTPVKQRMALIDEFNNSSEIFIFILTTKVGGLGTNLTGANRVIIYDPDWNPSTDTQARERAWRIGQTRDVTIYRLITRGTIEEKVYHRQIYKHFLTNKILKDPQQKRFFKARDMRDLFTLQDDEVNGSTETSSIFGQLSKDINVVIPEDKREKLKDMSSINAVKDVETARTSDSEAATFKNKGKSKANEADVSDEETSVLKSLFDAHGIHSAVNHDVILNANDDDRMRLDDQASLVAQKAAEALRQSRLLRSQDSFSVPTWTGKSGVAGAPSSIRKKFGSTANTSLLRNSKSSLEGSSSQTSGLQVGALTGRALSSAELIARTQGNREKAEHDGLEHQFRSSLSSNPTVQLQRDSQAKPLKKKTIVQPEVLIRQICSFIQQRGGSTDSGSIVQHFRDRVPSSDLPLFRNLLKEIAVLEKNANGSHWVLKEEYQE